MSSREKLGLVEKKCTKNILAKWNNFGNVWTSIELLIVGWLDVREPKILNIQFILFKQPLFHINIYPDINLTALKFCLLIEIQLISTKRKLQGCHFYFWVSWSIEVMNHDIWSSLIVFQTFSYWFFSTIQLYSLTSSNDWQNSLYWNWYEINFSILLIEKLFETPACVPIHIKLWKRKSLHKISSGISIPEYQSQKFINRWFSSV